MTFVMIVKSMVTYLNSRGFIRPGVELATSNRKEGRNYQKEGIDLVKQRKGGSAHCASAHSFPEFQQYSLSDI